jgi:uncharacterized membrane protein YgcG
MKRLLGIFALLIAIASPSFGQYPEHIGAVNDFAKVLDSQTASRIEQKISGFHKESGVSVVVATVSTLNGVDVKEYSNKLFSKWGIGKKGEDLGVLFLVSMDPRRARIEVGYGLEESLTDGASGNIIRDHFVTKFRDKSGSVIAQASSGTEEVVDAIIAQLRNRPPSKSKLANTGASTGTQVSEDGMGFWEFLFTFIAVFILFAGIGMWIFHDPKPKRRDDELDSDDFLIQQAMMRRRTERGNFPVQPRSSGVHVPVTHHRNHGSYTPRHVPPPVIIDEPDPEPTRVESRTSDDYQVDKVKDDEPSVDLDTDGRSGGAGADEAF